MHVHGSNQLVTCNYINNYMHNEQQFITKAKKEITTKPGPSRPQAKIPRPTPGQETLKK